MYFDLFWFDLLNLQNNPNPFEFYFNYNKY